MKKKLLSLIIVIILLCGCENINNKNELSIINEFGPSNVKLNTYRTGYKYYLPKGLNVNEYSLYNEIIESNKYYYYLYVDIISYFNKKEFNYEENNSSYFSKKITKDDKIGYLEINLQENNQYLIEIMFNYAKIEVMVDYEDISLALEYAVKILDSIEYNEKVIANLVGNDVLNYQEEIYNIFNTTSEDSNYLTMIEEDNYVEENDDIKDTDLIN